MNTAPLLLHVFPTFAVGGSQARFVTLANRFGPKYRHAIIALDGVFGCFERLGAHVDAERWMVPSPKHNTFGNIRTFRRILRERAPNLLVTYNWGAIEWALANRPRLIPHIHIEDGFGPEEAHGQIMRRVLTRRVALAKSMVVLPSRTLHRIALEKWHLPAGRVRHVPNGIDAARFKSCQDLVPLPAGEGPVIGTVAALRPEKNISRLIRAFRAVREGIPCRLVIAGDGPERSDLESLAEKILPAESYAFLGHIDDVERVHAALDVFALSSDTEQMPTALMEAMAAGRPVVATDVGDVGVLVSAENRAHITACDDQQFIASLLRLSSDVGLRISVGHANRVVAQRDFGLDKMLTAYDALFATTKGCNTSAVPAGHNLS